MELSIKQRVELGWQLLNRHFGTIKWQKAIELDSFDIYSLDDCLLGQLFGDWRRGCDIIGIGRAEESILHGFAYDNVKDSDNLTKEWKQRIREFRKVCSK